MTTMTDDYDYDDYDYDNYDIDNYDYCNNGITNSSRITLPLLLKNKSQTCAKKQVLQKNIQRAMYTAD